MKKSNHYWPIAILAGSLINISLFLVLPGLGYSEPPPPAPVIKLDMVAWQKPVSKQPTQKKLPPPPKTKPKPAPKPKPVVKPVIPKPTPPKPVEKPVLTEKESPKEPEPAFEQPPEEAVEPPPIEQMQQNEDEEALPTPAPIFEVTNLPRFAHKVRPVYPPKMLAQNKEANVKVEALIDSKGVVRQVTILKSGGELFDQAAIEAVMACSFVPGDINGKPVAVLLRIPIPFTLR